MAKTPSTPNTQASDAKLGTQIDDNHDILVDGGSLEDTFASGDSWGVFEFQAADLDNGIEEINAHLLNSHARSSDVLNVGDVLSDTSSDNNLGGYLHLTVTDAANGIITLGVDANGPHSGGDYTTLASIAMPNMTLSAGATSAEILNTLLQHHEIKF
jgi:hypothetical protein